MRALAVSHWNGYASVMRSGSVAPSYRTPMSIAFLPYFRWVLSQHLIDELVFCLLKRSSYVSRSPKLRKSSYQRISFSPNSAPPGDSNAATSFRHIGRQNR